MSKIEGQIIQWPKE